MDGEPRRRRRRQTAANSSAGRANDLIQENEIRQALCVLLAAPTHVSVINTKVINLRGHVLLNDLFVSTSC